MSKKLEKIKIYAVYTPSHETFVKKWFVPSIDKSQFKLTLKKEKQLGTGDYGGSSFNQSTLYKVNEIIKAIENNRGKFFVFSDVDIQFFDNVKEEILKLFKNQDLLFQCNGKNGEICTGFFVCQANKRTLNFWRDVKQIILTKDVHDQVAVNLLLIEKPQIDVLFGKFINKILLGINQKIVDLNIANNFIYSMFLPFIVNKYHLRWSYLPDKFYNPGLTRRERWVPGKKLSIPTNIVIHHANWTKGLNNKISQLKYVKKIFLKSKSS